MTQNTNTQIDWKDSIYNASGYIVLGGLLLAYFIFQAMIFNMPIIDLIQDFKSWMHTLFTIFTQSVAVGVGFDKGLTIALESKEFKLADEKNSEIIKFINNNQGETIEYIAMLNQNAILSVESDYLLSVGKLSVDDLNAKERKELTKIKPVRYSSEGLNTPLYYEKTRGNKINYNASFNAGSKTKKQFGKIGAGLLFGFMTLAPQFTSGNIGNALWSTVILTAGVGITYFMNYNRPIIQFTKVIPKRVDNKYTFYLGLKEYIKNSEPKVETLDKLINTYNEPKENNTIILATDPPQDIKEKKDY